VGGPVGPPARFPLPIRSQVRYVLPRMTRRYHRQNSKTTKFCPAHDGGKGAELPLSKFYLEPHQAGGRNAYCKKCCRSRRVGRYARSTAEARVRVRYATLRGASKRKGLPFDLSFIDFQKIISQACVYGDGIASKAPIAIDRKEPGKGYVRGNCVASCPRHNLIKGNVFSFASMLRIVREFPEAGPCGGVFYKKVRKAEPSRLA
jgi:hypothetical protein